MRKIIAVLLAGTMLSPAVAREIDQTLDADPKSRISVFNTAGSIEIRGWTRNAVNVTGDIGDDVEEFVFERSGRDVTIKVKTPNRSGRHDISSNLVIRLPRESSIDVAAVSADIDIRDVLGEQNLQAISGDIETHAFEGDISIETVSGDIDVEGSGKEGDAEMSSVSGDINASKLRGTLEAGSVSGDVDIDDGVFSRVALETVNGDVAFVGRLAGEARFSAESVNGTIDIEFTGPVSARFDIETFNGDIDNCFGPAPQRTSRYAPGWSLSFTEGDGEGRVDIATLNGDLILCKQ